MNYLREATHRVIDLITREVFSLLGTGRQVAPFSVRYPGFSLVDAYEVVALLCDMRRAARREPGRATSLAPRRGDEDREQSGRYVCSRSRGTAHADLHEPSAEKAARHRRPLTLALTPSYTRHHTS